MRLKKKIIISIIFFLGLSILLIVFVLYPLFLEIKKISQDFLSQKQKLTVLEKKIENLEKFKLTFLEILPGLEKIESLFVDSEVPVDFIHFLEKTSRDSKILLKISSISPLKTEKDPWPSISFQLSLAGSFPDLTRFLEKLESGLYLIEIQNLNIAHLTETELKSKEYEKFSPGDVKGLLSLRVFIK